MTEQTYPFTEEQMDALRIWLKDNLEVGISTDTHGDLRIELSLCNNVISTDWATPGVLRY
jgi:hypothetical protein